MIEEIKRLKIDILGISELRCPKIGIMRVEAHDNYYSGNNDTQYLLSAKRRLSFFFDYNTAQLRGVDRACERRSVDTFLS